MRRPSARSTRQKVTTRNISNFLGRPLSDPCIVHIADSAQALEFVDIDDEIKELFLFLTDRFWPGPFTCVLKADLTKIPFIVTASTGYVGVRYPKNETAQALIRASQRPIAAPSANLFSHVSPTSPVHVFNDFYDQEVQIIDGSNCEFGIESTVVKILRDEETKVLSLLILRAGSLSEKSIREALSGSKFQDMKVEKFKKEGYVKEETNVEAPGVFLKHYSPYIETFLLEPYDEKPQDSTTLELDKKSAILIDFAGHLKQRADEYLKYFSLSDSGDMREAMGSLYNVLREAENVPDGKAIFILNLSQYYQNYKKEIDELPEFLETVYDKSFRSASGKKVKFDLKNGQFFE